MYIQPHATQTGANNSTQIPNAHSIPADRILWLLADHFKRLISEPYSDLTLTRSGWQGSPELYSSAYSLTRLFSQPRGAQIPEVFVGSTVSASALQVNGRYGKKITNYIFVKSHHFTFNELVEGFEALDI